MRCRTPEYMSPELLRNREDRAHPAAYDPRSVDVWAAGVMLIVSLCGAFPFDHTRAHEGFTDDAELDLWCALVARVLIPEGQGRHTCN